MSEHTLILHAGQHKTGSSAIQGYLYARFSHPDTVYVHDHKANSSLWMLQAFKQDFAKNPTFRHLDLSEDEVIATRECARTRLLNAIDHVRTKPSHILSAESISMFTVDELTDLRDLLLPIYREIQIHQYFRPLKSRMESAFQEKLKHYFAPISQKFHLDYRRSVSKFDEVFGRENVFVYKYDKSRFTSGCIVRDFLGHLGIDLGEEKPALTNIGLSLDAVRLLYTYRSHYPHRDCNDEKRIAKLVELAGEPLRFHSELFRQLLVSRKGSMEWFEERAGFSMHEDLTACDEFAVRCEADLFKLSERALDWLKANSSSTFTSVARKDEIAEAVRNLIV